ncbi:MAG: nucleotidyltransferase domain-containing protein [Elusimicrobiota bacterium]|nr:nucleotidyltransferase domain-containing protein [Elusimicrobiota bacterium]
MKIAGKSSKPLSKKIKAELKFLTGSEKKTVLSLVSEMKLKFKNKISDVRLFGSKARGNFNKDSDIDIFVLLRSKHKKKSDVDGIDDLFFDYEFDTGCPLAHVIFDMDEYRKNTKLKSFFFENVEKEGVSLWQE